MILEPQLLRASFATPRELAHTASLEVGSYSFFGEVLERWQDCPTPHWDRASSNLATNDGRIQELCRAQAGHEGGRFLLRTCSETNHNPTTTKPQDVASFPQVGPGQLKALLEKWIVEFQQGRPLRPRLPFCRTRLYL